MKNNQSAVLVSNLFHTRLPCVERRLDDFLLILSLQEYENIVEVVASLDTEHLNPFVATSVTGYRLKGKKKLYSSLRSQYLLRGSKWKTWFEK